MQYEFVDFSAHMPVRCIMYHLGQQKKHLHDHFEILFLLSGSCTVLVDGQPTSLEAEDILAIDPRVPHELRGVNANLISVQFQQSLFESTLPYPVHPRFSCNSALQGNNASFDRMRRLIAQLVKNNVDQQPGYELRNWSIVYMLMDEFYNNFRVDSANRQESRAHRYAARIAEITSIINAQYTENLTLSEVASQVFLSAPYLSKFFDQQFGMTFLNYLTKVRLNHAVEELLYTEHTIDIIAEHSGFPNSQSFVKAFRREYEALPSIYRRNFQRSECAKNPMAVEQRDYMASLKKYLTEPVAPASNSDQAILCTGECSAAKPLRMLRHTWRTLLDVGRAADLLIGTVQDMVRQVQRDIGYTYIKLGGVLSDELRLCFRGMDGKLVFSFTYLDKVLDFLREVGLRPLMQLSFMPEALARDPNKKIFGHLVSEPTELSEWVELVTSVTRHVLERYGREEVRRWLFTVWTQPETPQFMYAFSSDNAFCRFYQCTYAAVKGCDDALTFGAPASYYIVQPGYHNWYLHFLGWCSENGCTPDFLSFVYYDTTLVNGPQKGQSGKEAFGFVGSMQLNQATDGFQKFVDQLLAETRRQLGWEGPIYLTEWNSSPSQQDLLNDTCFKSCYIARSVLEHYDRLDSFGYHSLTDWMSEAPLPKEQFFGGLGLFTVDGIPKAAYQVLRMMRQLGDTLLGQGPGWFVTTGEGGYQVILYNYRHFTYLYAMGERFDMTFTDRYTAFSPEQALDVHLRLKDVEGGTYLVREVLLNRKHGSAFDIWASMGAMELDTQEELDYLNARSIPALRKFTLEAKDGTMELDAWLDMLEARLLLIEPLK